ncbi:MAG: HD domain-containing protein [Solirubrobacteraceae bacterium]
MLVNQLTDGQDIDIVLLVRDRQLRTKRDGGEYLKLGLADRTGSVSAIIRDDIATVGEVCTAGCAVRVAGRYSVHPRYGAEVDVHTLRAAEPDEVDLDALTAGPPRSATQMEADLRDLVATIQNPHLHALLEAIFGDGTPTWEAFRAAPAAKYYHQAYRHGLLEHCLSVAQSVSAISATFPGIDREVAVCGALLHDIGKLDALAATGAAIDMTDVGKLQGEIPLGYFRIRRLIEDLPGFPEHLAGAVLHIILSHHGALEYGSPVVPCTREATLVHMIDNLGGRLGSFDRLEKELPQGSQWSAFDRAIGGGAFFADRQAA